jgi:hypothetical protein
VREMQGTWGLQLSIGADSQRQRLFGEVLFWGFHQISAQYLVNTDESLWNMLILFFHFYTISLTFPFQIQYSFRFCS